MLLDRMEGFCSVRALEPKMSAEEHYAHQERYRDGQDEPAHGEPSGDFYA